MENADDFFQSEEDSSFGFDHHAEAPDQFDFSYRPEGSSSWPSPFRTYTPQNVRRTLLSQHWQCRTTFDTPIPLGVPHFSLNDPLFVESTSPRQGPTLITTDQSYPRDDVDLSECFQLVNDILESEQNTQPSRIASIENSLSVQQSFPASPKAPKTEPALPADPNAATRAAAIAAAAIDPGRGVPGRFKCQFDGCSLTFDRRYNLKTHYRKHTDERPYKCKEPGCKKTYRWRSSAHHHKTAHALAKTKILKGTYPLPTPTPRNIRPVLPSSVASRSPQFNLSTRESMPVEEGRRLNTLANDFSGTVKLNLNDHESSS